MRDFKFNRIQQLYNTKNTAYCPTSTIDPEMFFADRLTMTMVATMRVNFCTKQGNNGGQHKRNENVETIRARVFNDDSSGK